MSMADMLPENKLDVINNLRQNKFLILHYSKIKILVYVFLLCYLVTENTHFFKDNGCIITMPSDGSKWFREPENCDICRNVHEIPKIHQISPQEFHKKYAKPATPIIVQGGAASWPAMKVFSFDFFKSIHRNVDMNRGKKKNCQFFPYKTEFKYLDEVFNMSRERAELAEGEKSWYVGWSNCNDEAGKALKSYYSKPDFLGNYSENIALTWIFMGGPGDGAQMHVDNVHYPSWQAQLSGRKLWKLAPPPECYYVCQKHYVIVEPGDIIVVNTNRWYHQTFVLRGSLSITIGSEFD